MRKGVQAVYVGFMPLMLLELVGAFLVKPEGAPQMPQSVFFGVTAAAVVSTMVSRLVSGKWQGLGGAFLSSFLNLHVVVSGFLLAYLAQNPYVILPYFFLGFGMAVHQTAAKR